MILKNAPIVILDEATTFTDQENEEKIQQSIAALTKGKTLLAIAHRLSTIKNADQIIVCLLYTSLAEIGADPLCVELGHFLLNEPLFLLCHPKLHLDVPLSVCHAAPPPFP